MLKFCDSLLHFGPAELMRMRCNNSLVGWVNMRLDTCIHTCVFKIYTFPIICVLLVRSLGPVSCRLVLHDCDLLLKAMWRRCFCILWRAVGKVIYCSVFWEILLLLFVYFVVIKYIFVPTMMCSLVENICMLFLPHYGIQFHKYMLSKTFFVFHFFLSGTVILCHQHPKVFLEKSLWHKWHEVFKRSVGIFFLFERNIEDGSCSNTGGKL